MNTTNGNHASELLERADDSTKTLNSNVIATRDSGGIASSLKKIGDVSQNIEKRMRCVVGEIETINSQTRLLSLNAQIEAVRAGDAGRSFHVVAREMVELSNRTAKSAVDLDDRTTADIQQLNGIISEVEIGVRGTRFSDLAFTNIDLIDRNLYERSCDVRWWATDSSCVEALEDPAKAEYASRRLGIILDAYTVYYDIVLCDLNGVVVSNGRPGSFSSVGSRQERTGWFRSARATSSGSEFGFEGLHCSPSLANGQKILVYSALVREGGRADGAPLGCLGIVFNWDALAQTIVKNTQLGEGEGERTRVIIVDQAGKIIADNRERHLRETFPLREFPDLISCQKGYAMTRYAGCPHLVAYAGSAGYETYSTGWHSFILQPLQGS